MKVGVWKGKFMILTDFLLYVFLCLLLVIIISLNLCEGARGARNMMNRRNKQKSRGGGGRSQGNAEATAEGCL
jgi:hypothetical protein